METWDRPYQTQHYAQKSTRVVVYLATDFKTLALHSDSLAADSAAPPSLVLACPATSKTPKSSVTVHSRCIDDHPRDHPKSINATDYTREFKTPNYAQRVSSNLRRRTGCEMWERSYQTHMHKSNPHRCMKAPRSLVGLGN